MCDPVTLAGAAASAGGAVANYDAQSRVRSARGGVLADALNKQNTLNGEAAGVNAHSLGLYDNVGGQMTDRTSSLSQLFGDPHGTTATPTAMPASSSIVTQGDVAKKTGEATTFSNQQAGALANLRSFGDVMGGLSRSQARDAGQVAQISNFKTGDANLVPYQLENANHTADGEQFLSKVLSGLGAVGVTAGLSGGAGKLASLFATAPTSLAAPGIAVAPGAAIGQIVPPTATQAFNPYQIY